MLCQNAIIIVEWFSILFLYGCNALFQWVVCKCLKLKNSKCGISPFIIWVKFYHKINSVSQYNKKMFLVDIPKLHYSVHSGINLSSKTPRPAPPSFLPSPSLNLLSKRPLFRQSAPIYWFLVNPPKSQIFLWNPKILKFFIFHSILSFKSN